MEATSGCGSEDNKMSPFHNFEYIFPCDSEDIDDTEPRLPVLRFPLPNRSRADEDTLGCNRFCDKLCPRLVVFP